MKHGYVFSRRAIIKSLDGESRPILCGINYVSKILLCCFLFGTLAKNKKTFFGLVSYDRSSSYDAMLTEDRDTLTMTLLKVLKVRCNVSVTSDFVKWDEINKSCNNESFLMGFGDRCNYVDGMLLIRILERGCSWVFAWFRKRGCSYRSLRCEKGPHPKKSTITVFLFPVSFINEI